MTEYQDAQASLLSLGDDVSALIAEMKRRAGVATDQDLAQALGLAQSTVSYWRTRGRVSERTILKAEQSLEEVEGLRAGRVLASWGLILSLPGRWASALPPGPTSQWIAALSVAGSLMPLRREAEARIRMIEEERGVPPEEALMHALADLSLLDELIATVRQRPTVPQSVPQSPTGPSRKR